MPDRPDLGTPTPLWQVDVAPPALPPLTGDLTADVIVVGAGITGLTTALLLHEAGTNVAVVEARAVADGVTGHSTGHLTELVDVGYRTIRKDFGEEGAATVARVTRGAIQEVRRVAGQYGIECGLRTMPAYYYADSADDEAGARAFQEEADAAEAAGLRVERLERAPLPFATGPALAVRDQAVFDPYAYTVGVARVLAAAGVPVYEGVRVQGIEPGERVTLSTENGQTLHARRVVLATHTPLGFNPLQTVVFPYRSYVLAVDPGVPPPEGMFFDTNDPYHYTRPADDGLLIVGGADHKTGQGGADAAPYEEVLDYVHARYPGATVRYRWSSEVFDAADGLPSIGPSPFQAGVLVATGYSGDGLLWGTAAARILASLARDEEHPDADLFSPARFKPLAAGPSFLKENIDVAFHFIADRVATDAESVEAVPAGGGALVRVAGRHLAVHRTDDGAVHAFSPVCPHLQCVVRWNGADRTWDCPCHGARYDAATGAVLSGPAMHGLSPEEV